MKKMLCMLLVGLPLCVRAQIRDTLIISQSDVTIELDGQGYHHVKYGDNHVMEAGAPELPIITKQYYIPNDAADIQLTATILNEQQIDGVYNVYPSQGLIPITQEKRPFVELSDTWSDSIYPTTVAEILSDSRIFGYRMVTVCYHPFAYNVGSGALITRNVGISLSYTVSSDGSSETLQSSYRKNKCKEYVKSLVENPDLLDETTAEEPISTYTREVPIRLFAEGRPIPDFIIITNEELKPAFKQLAEWKTRRGIYTVIETTEYIDSVCSGVDLCEKIRNYIQEKEDCWGEGLAILLGGGIDIIPARTFNGTYGKQVTDMYYIDRKFHMPNELIIYQSIDIRSTIGRLPIDNITEAEIIVQKQLSYEKANTPSTNHNYYNNILITNGYNNISSINGELQFRGGGMSSYYHLKEEYPLLNYYFMFDFFNQGPNVLYKGEEHVLSVYQKGIEHGEELTRTGFINALLKGSEKGFYHLILHDDHSYPTMMGTSWTAKNECVTRDDIKSWEFPEGYYQVILSKGCHPADFEVPCIAKEYLVKPKGGAVAYIGNTDVGYEDEYYYMEKFHETVYDSSNKWDWESHIGNAWINIVQATTNYLYPKSRIHILGDPTLAFWTSNPTEYDTYYELSGQFLKISRPDELIGYGSTVCLYKKDEVYLIDTLCSRKEMTFYLRDIKTSGFLYITTTGLTQKPQMDSLYIDLNAIKELEIKEIELIDTINGTGDKLLAPGETAYLNITYENTSNQTIAELPVSIANIYDDSNIQLLNYRDTLYNIFSGETQQASFEFKVLNSAPNMTEHNKNGLLLGLYENLNHTYLGEFAINIQKPQPKIEEVCLSSETENSHQITIYYYNNGKNTFIGEKAKLSNNNNISVTSPVKTINNVLLNEDESHSITFNLTTTQINDSDSLVFELFDTYNNVYSFIIKPFISSPNPPTKNDIKLIPGDTFVDIKGELYMAFNSTDGINFSSVPIWRFEEPYFRHIGLQPQTKYYYKFMAKKDGKFSDLSETMPVTTTPALLDGFPKTVENTNYFKGLINCWDINHDGKKEIIATTWDNIDGNGALIAVNSSGEDIYSNQDLCIINRITDTNGNFMNGVAIGELYDDGEQYIVSTTYSDSLNSINSVYCYKATDENNDGSPDLYWRLDSTIINSPRSPIIADLDNDDVYEIIVPSIGNVTIFEANGNIRNTIYCNNKYKHLSVASVIPNSAGKQLIIPNGKSLAVYDSAGLYLAQYSTSLSCDVSTPVVCDYDKDGYKEAIVGEIVESTNDNGMDTVKIYAIKYLTTGVSVQYLYKYNGRNMIEGRKDVPIAVGDLNKDGYFEIVSNSYNKPFIYNHSNFNNPTPIEMLGIGVMECHETPMIADVDGDDTLDIIIQQYSINTIKFTNQQGYVTAVNHMGEYIDGIILPTFGSNFDGLMVADIDNNGTNEIASGTMQGRLYVWESKDNSNHIAWGSSRGNPQNTGEYTIPNYPNLKYNEVYDSNILNNDLYVLGNSVTINQTLTFASHKKIVVWENGVLNIDGATLNNARIVVKPGGKVNIINGAVINLRDDKSFIVPKGAQLRITNGRIIN